MTKNNLEGLIKEFKIELNSWVKRLVSLGQIEDYQKRKGGWTLFMSPELEGLLTKAHDLGIAKGREVYSAGYASGYNQCLVNHGKMTQKEADRIQKKNESTKLSKEDL